jgi:hypothetical protein
MLFINFFPTSKKTQRIFIAEINWLTMFKEMVAVYSENHTKTISLIAELLLVKAGGTFFSHRTSKG